MSLKSITIRWQNYLITTAITTVTLLTIPVFAQKTVKISGSVPFKEQYFDPNLAAINEKTKLIIEVIGNGTDRGIADLIEGRSDVAMLAAPLADIAKKMNEKKPGYIDVTLLKELKVGICEIVLVVNTANKIDHLTSTQAIGILSGTIKNWKDVGGSDMAVSVVVAMPGNGIRTNIEKQLLKETPFAADSRQVTNPAQVITVVSQLQGGIGPLGMSMVDSKISVVKISDKKILAPMILVTKGEPSADVVKLVEVLKEYN
jgi:phosphate transport system substrate-binding protein